MRLLAKKPSRWCDREGQISQDTSHLAPAVFPNVGLGTTIKRFNWSLKSIHYGYARVINSRRKRSRAFSTQPIRAMVCSKCQVRISTPYGVQGTRHYCGGEMPYTKPSRTLRRRSYLPGQHRSVGDSTHPPLPRVEYIRLLCATGR